MQESGDDIRKTGDDTRKTMEAAVEPQVPTASPASNGTMQRQWTKKHHPDEFSPEAIKFRKDANEIWGSDKNGHGF